jgi:exopolysaccharide production protein ExoY
MELAVETSGLMATSEVAAMLPPLTATASIADASESAASPQPLRTSELREPDLQDRAARALDIAISVFLLIFLLPLMLAITVILLPTGNVIFAQKRIGLDGQEFRCLKFRTMVVDAEARLAALLAACPISRAEWELSQKLQNDPRITMLGRFLRKTSLDELPQLLNILGGTMSVVGPRPIVASEIARYGRYFPQYCAVKPGLTGLWQVSGRSSTSYSKRVALDVLYVKKRSLSMYMFIIFKTPYMVISANGSC